MLSGEYHGKEQFGAGASRLPLPTLHTSNHTMFTGYLMNPDASWHNQIVSRLFITHLYHIELVLS